MHYALVCWLYLVNDIDGVSFNSWLLEYKIHQILDIKRILRALVLDLLIETYCEMYLSFFADVDHSILCNAHVFYSIVSAISVLVGFIRWIHLVCSIYTSFVYFELLQANFWITLWVWLLNDWKRLVNLTLADAEALALIDCVMILREWAIMVWRWFYLKEVATICQEHVLFNLLNAYLKVD